jgi:hypothetical protein
MEQASKAIKDERIPFTDYRSLIAARNGLPPYPLGGRCLSTLNAEATTRAESTLNGLSPVIADCPDKLVV